MSKSTKVILLASRDDANADVVCAAIADTQTQLDLHRVDPSEFAGMKMTDGVVLLISDTGLNSEVRLDISGSPPSLVQFLGRHTPIGLVSELQSGGSTVAGISPVVAPRIANRVAGFGEALGVSGKVGAPVWGVVGIGFAGSEVAKKLLSSGSSVTVADVRTPRSGLLADLNVRRLTLDLLLTGADAVTLHIHAGPTASPLISARELNLMKDEAVLINTAHSSTVDEDAVIDALESGRLGGYATDCPGDVVANASQLLVSSRKLLVTTNSLTSQIGASQQIAKFVIGNIESYLKGKTVAGAIDLIDFPNVGDPSFWASRMSPRQD